MSSLQFITQAVGSSVTSLSVTNCFSADYENYLIQQTDYTAHGANAQSIIRLINSSGTVISATDYNIASQFMPSYSSFVEDRYTSRSFLFDGLSVDQNDTIGGGATFHLFSPFDSSKYTFGLHQQASFNTGSGVWGRKNIAVLKQTVSITGLQILSTGSTTISTNIKIFGVK